MPFLGVVPYIELNLGLTHYVISYRLYSAEDMRAKSHLVSPYVLGRVLIEGPIQCYLDARPEAARLMLYPYGLNFSSEWEFYQQMLRRWYRTLTDDQASHFPDQPAQRFPCAYQPPYLIHIPDYCGGGTGLYHLKARECALLLISFFAFFHLGSITSTPGHYRNTASNCFDHELTIYRIAFFYRFYALQTYSENATYLR